MTVARSVSRRAHAKLNVCLRVLGRRDDGYHEVETLVLPLELHDVVQVTEEDGLIVDVTGQRAAELAAAGGEELALAAARGLGARCGSDAHRHGASIAIDKRIPVAAGLGGGSADAAATLRALRELWGCEVTDEELATVGAAVGSDVPPLLVGDAVFCTGRGDVVHPVHAQTTFWVVRPFAFGVATADAYAWWDADGAATGPDPGALVAALETGNDELLGSALANDLEASVVRRHPEVGETIEAFHAAGALGAAMTGSGPTVIALARHLGHADRVAEGVSGSFVTSGPPRTMAP